MLLFFTINNFWCKSSTFFLLLQVYFSEWNKMDTEWKYKHIESCI